MRFFSTIILSLIISFSFAQISITFPMEKAVFQRNLNNTGTINIAGTYTSTITSADARFTNLLNNQIIIDWTPFTTNVNGSVYYGSVSNIPGGWYKLEVRGKLNGNIIGTATLNKVGIGEVFLIAGQSNAQGLEGDQAEVGSSDERVLSHNELSWYDTQNNQCNQKVPNYPSFTQIFSNGGTRSSISKTGATPWCYGKLGDNLVSKLGVPVVFYNSGATATSSNNWKESSDGLPTTNIYSNAQYCNAVGVPYSNLKKTINYYASTFGVRAILWHQGETDNFANVQSNNYTSNINHVINKSRAELGNNIPWVIAKASVFDKNANGGAGNSNSNIINAQNSLVNSGNKIYPGPSTDDILGSNRSDEVHFYGSGLIELANRWDAALSIDFFNDATPISAKPLPMVSVSCHSTTEQKLTAPSGYSTYKWVRTDTGNGNYEDATESTTQTIDRSSGTYRCYLIDGQGNISFTQTVTVQNVAQQCSCVGITACSGVSYISNYQPCSSTNGWGPIEMDKSNGDSGAGDGTTITLRGVTYAKGIGVNANSEIKYNINNNFGRLIADIGIDDEVSNSQVGATVIFKVYKDNILAYTSSILNKTSAIVRINIDVKNTNELKLVVEDAGDNIFSDHADWAGLRLHCVDTQAPSAPSSLVESQVSQNCVTLTWAASTDNMEVEKYNVYRDGVLIGTVNAPITTYKVTGLAQLNYYQFRVKAVDYSGNVSSQSNLAEVVTLQDMLLSFSKKLINVGQTSSLYAYGCFGGTVTWSNGSTANPTTVSPTDTTIYSVNCKIGDCTSATVKDTVKVIPNCKSTYSFVNPKNNYEGSTTSLTFNAAQTISASNFITNQATINYNAAKSITLLPGFTASAGTVFQAKIGGCTNPVALPIEILNVIAPNIY